jgi:hypothetical protein
LNEQISFYEQVGIVIPGSVLVFGLVMYYPQLQLLTVKDGMSVGELGLFVLIAYAAGHLIAAIANALENLFWGMLGGMPSDWVTHDPPTHWTGRMLAKAAGVSLRKNPISAKK